MTALALLEAVATTFAPGKGAASDPISPGALNTVSNPAGNPAANGCVGSVIRIWVWAVSVVPPALFESRPNSSYIAVSQVTSGTGTAVNFVLIAPEPTVEEITTRSLPV